MTSRDFCFWLQGHLEISKSTSISASQLTIIKRHLAMVFKYEIDTSLPDPTGELQAIHNPPGLAAGKYPPVPPPHGGDDKIYRC